MEFRIRDVEEYDTFKDLVITRADDAKIELTIEYPSNKFGIGLGKDQVVALASALSGMARTLSRE